MTYDPDYKVQPDDLLSTGATEQDDFDPDIAEWADVTSDYDPRIPEDKHTTSALDPMSHPAPAGD